MLCSFVLSLFVAGVAARPLVTADGRPTAEALMQRQSAEFAVVMRWPRAGGRMSARRFSGSSVAGALGRTPWLKGLPREVGVLAGIAFCVALGFGIVAPSIPIFAKTFGVSALLAGAVVSVFALMRLITAPGAGWLVNRMGERKVLAAGLAIVAASSLVAGFAATYDQLLVMRGLGGIGSAMFTVSALALLLRTAGPDQRGRAAGAFQAGFLFGGVTGPALGGLVVGWSIRAPFFVYAFTLSVATVVALVFLRPHPDQESVAASAGTSRFASGAGQLADDPAREVGAIATGSSADAATLDASSLGSATPESEPVRLGTALRSRSYLAACVANLATGFTAFGLRTSLIPLFVVEYLQRGPGFAGLGFLISAVFQAVTLLPGGRLADQRGRRPAMIIGTMSVVVGMSLLVIDTNIWLYLASMAILGIGTAFLGSAPAAVVGDIGGGHRGGTVVAAFQMVSDVGAISGPLIAGLLADHLGFHWAFLSGVAISLVAAFFAFLMPETRRDNPPAAPDQTAAPADG